MSAPCIELAVALADRDPETLLGPLLWMLTRLARGELEGGERADLLRATAAHCVALCAHPNVPPALRLAVGGIAIEQRERARTRG